MRNGPDYVQFYPTLRCNRSCDFCFNRALPVERDMSLEAFRTLLLKLAAVSVKTIDIIGGEPTMHPDIVQFIAEAVGSGFHVNLSSNGTNIDVLEKIMKAGDKVTVGVSVNDGETLDHLREFIGENRPVVKTVFQPSVDFFTRIADILLLKPRKFFLIYRDATERAELGATVPFPNFLSGVATRFNSRQAGTVYCSGFISDPTNYPELSQVRCPAGTTKIGIMPDGSVYPCNLFFGRKEFLLGNILLDPFDAIWSNTALTFFRTHTENKCSQRSCELHGRCHGGCPAQALHLSDDLSAPDPRCVGKSTGRKNLI